MRRRRFVLAAHPMNDLVAVDIASGTWAAAGNEPSFELTTATGRLPAGWVAVDLELETSPAAPRPLLRVDRVGGTPSDVALPWPEHRRVAGVVKLPPPVESIRLLLADGPETVRVGRLAMREIGRPEIALRLLRRILASLVRDPERLRGVLPVLRAAFEREGWRGIKKQLVGAPHVDGEPFPYVEWIARFDMLRSADRQAIRRRIAALSRRPLFSVLLLADGEDELSLRRTIGSVVRQLHPDWELRIAGAPAMERLLRDAAGREPRASAVCGPTTIDASNRALDSSRGEFVVIVRAGDELSRHALYMLAEEVDAYPEADVVYSDEDLIDASGRRDRPDFKPDWSPDLLLSRNYVGDLAAYRTALVRRVGGFRGRPGYDLTLRCVALTSRSAIRHVPYVLYHRSADRTLPDEQGELAALRNHVTTIDPRIGVEPGRFPGLHRVRYPVPDPPPLVTVIVPTRDRHRVLLRCVESVLAKTTYPRLELIIVDNESRDAATLRYLAELADAGRARILRYERPFNYSAINNFAAASARGEVLALVNDDVEVLAPEWLAEMVSHAVRPGIGAVGARLLYPDGTVQHAGVVLGLFGVTGHVHSRLSPAAPGYFGRAHAVHDVSAVTGACLVVRRELFEQVGGLDEEHLPITLNDIDLCLRLEAAGYRTVWTPYAELLHHESFSRGPEDTVEKRLRARRERDYMRRHWGRRFAVDPYYSPNLSLRSTDVTLAWPPRTRAPWRNG